MRKAENKAGGDFEKPAIGKYSAIVCGIYDIGTQAAGVHGPKHKITIQWELHRRKGPARDEAGNVFTIYQDYGYTVGGDSYLKKDMLLMLPPGFVVEEDGFDPEEMMGTFCILNVKHNVDGSKTYANVETITRLDIEEDHVPTPELNSVTYEIDASKPIPDNVPKFVQNKIRRSKEWVAVHGEPKQGEKTQTKMQTASDSKRPKPAAIDDDNSDDPPF